MDVTAMYGEAEEVVEDLGRFSRYVTGVPLRRYQLEVANAVLDSVLRGRGLTFAVLMSRQAGKNETAAQLEALLLVFFARSGGWLVKASPTFQPQSLNSLLRLEARLDNPCTRGHWRREAGRIVRVGNARALFLSAQPGASVVGATASILLEADEAQDIPEEKWNKDFRPMGASANVTTVLWGTAWTPDTLLARTVERLRRQEEEDGVRRVFRVPWREVAAEVPEYGSYVREEIGRLGSMHPMVRTQYALEEVDGVGGMFPPARQARMQGRHPAHLAPEPEARYALCVDVAGQAWEEGEAGDGEGHNCTACTLFSIELPSAGDPLAGRPRYRVVRRWWWRGLPQAQLYARLVELAEEWSPRRVVVDATGLGEGLASFLAQRLGSRVMPYVFTTASKSQLGWAFLGICDTGRFQDHAQDGSEAQEAFRQQVGAARCELLPGPGRRLRWGVPRGEDDLLISAALCAALEEVGWGAGESFIIPAVDPIEEMDRARRRWDGRVVE